MKIVRECGRCGERFAPGDPGVHTCTPPADRRNLELDFMNPDREEIKRLRSELAKCTEAHDRIEADRQRLIILKDAAFERVKALEMTE